MNSIRLELDVTNKKLKEISIIKDVCTRCQGEMTGRSHSCQMLNSSVIFFSTRFVCSFLFFFIAILGIPPGVGVEVGVFLA